MDHLMPPASVPKKVASTDYSQFSTEQIKDQLSQRSLPTTGKRKALVKRLKAEVQRAWQQYNNNPSPSAKGLFKKRNNKPKRSAAEVERLIKENEAKRKANIKRKAQNIVHMEEEREKKKLKTEAKKRRRVENNVQMEEARERKRLKKEASAKLQAERMVVQKQEKEDRQKMEAFVTFDIKGYQEQLRNKLDPRGNKISSMSYNAAHKRFNIRFNDASDHAAVVQGSTIKKPKAFALKMTAHALAAPVESRCVMFLYPGAAQHPDAEAAVQWLESQVDECQDLGALKIWKDDALDTFSKFGKIINVYRERSFMIIQFSASSEAKKMMSNAPRKGFNGVQWVAMKIGTPTKQDKIDVNKDHPIPVLKKSKKKKD